ncbi:50S ribosomal protein L4 [Candidatus Dojkabacteria bacterium]|nr:50S ribosomal protein L4 [Candidatus Dojkabacteria bacterium]
MDIKVFDLTNKEVSKISLSPSVWNVDFDPAVIEKYVQIVLSNRRAYSASVKDRSEVRGGGRKPWAQKHTGRARHGSIRSPIWVGGGVAHGPVPGKRLKSMNQKERQLFYRVVLSKLVKENLVTFVSADSFEKLDKAISKETKGLTKLVLSKFNKFFNPNGLVIVSNDTYNSILLGLRNLNTVSAMGAKNVDWLQILNAGQVIMTDSAAKQLNDNLDTGKKND